MTTTNEGIVRKVKGIKARLCSEQCLEGYKADREAGLIYPPYKVNGEMMGVDKASIIAKFCAYCNRELGAQQDT